MSLLLKLITAAGGSSTTALPGVGLLVTTSSAPLLLGERLIQPGVGAVSIQGLAPSLYLERIIQPGVGLMLVGGLSPSALDDTQIAPTTGLVTINGLAPSLYLENTITPSAGLVTLSGLAPIVTATELVAVQPGVGFLQIVSDVPLVIDSNAAEQHVAMQIIGRAPTIIAGEVALSGYPRRGKRGKNFPQVVQLQLPIEPPNVPEPHWQPLYGQLPRLPRSVAPALRDELAERRARNRRDEETLALLLAA